MWRLVKLGYSRRAAAARVRVRDGRCSPRCPTRCWRCGSRCSRAVSRTDDRTVLMIAAAGIGLSAVATWFLRVVGDRTQRRFRDRVTIFLESHVARLQASVSTIEHHERPDYLDRLSVLRNQVFTLDHMYMSVFSTAGWILRLARHGRSCSMTCEPVARRCSSRSRSRRCSPRRGGRASSARPKKVSRHAIASRATSSCWARPRRPARRCGSTGIGPNLVEQRHAAWQRLVRARGAARAGRARSGTRSCGRSSASRT